MAVDDPGVRRRKRLGPQVALRDIPQTGFAERRVALVDERRVADVAGLRDEDSAEAGVEIRELRAGFLIVGEAVDEPCLRGDFEHEVGQVSSRHQAVYALA